MKENQKNHTNIDAIQSNLKTVSNFLFEVGMLKKIQRTGYPFLGSGRESVAEHSFRVAIIGHLLSELTNFDKPHHVVLMCLLHDISEARTGDQNYVHKQYVQTNEKKAFWDATENLPCTNLYRELWLEYKQMQSKAALLAHDADQLDLLLELKEQQDLGNPYAQKWISHVLKRLHTEAARALAKQILQTDWTSWWFDGHDTWWEKSQS